MSILPLVHVYTPRHGRTNEPTRGNKEPVRALNTRAGRVHALTSTSRRLTILSRRRGSPPFSVTEPWAVSRQWLAKKYFQLRNETPVFLIKTHRTDEEFFSTKDIRKNRMFRGHRKNNTKQRRTINLQPFRVERERERESVGGLVLFFCEPLSDVQMVLERIKRF